MKNSEVMQIVGGAIGFIAYLVGMYYIIRKKKYPSFASYALWAILDGIMLYHAAQNPEGANLPIIAGFTIGSAFTAIVLLVKVEFSWEKTEWIVTFLIIVCLYVKYNYNHDTMTIATATALMLAGVPLLIDTYKKPNTVPTLVWGIFAVGSTIAFFGKTSWALDEWLFSGTSAIYCCIITILSLREPRKIVH